MTSFLARVRRAFLAGTVSLIVLVVCNKLGYCEFFYVDSLMTGLRISNENASTIRILYCLFFTLSPFIYFALLLISTSYIRKHGLSAAYQQESPFIVTAIKCLRSDLTSPFRAVINVFSRHPDTYSAELARGSKAIHVLRFLWMLLWLAICVYGILWG